MKKKALRTSTSTPPPLSPSTKCRIYQQLIFRLFITTLLLNMKKEKKSHYLPTYPNFFGDVIGNTSNFFWPKENKRNSQKIQDCRQKQPVKRFPKIREVTISIFLTTKDPLMYAM